MTLALVGHFWTAGPRDFVPTWNDEIIYWNEIATFARAGFHGGYITAYERPARFDASRFGPHGPVFAATVGSLVRVPGWQPYSGFVVNLVVITLAAAVWVFALPRDVSAAVAALALATFWPFLIYLPSNMQEPWHFAIALAFAALLPRVRPGAAAWAAIVLIVVSAMLRPTWALLTVPVFWALLPRVKWIALPAGVVATGAAYAVFSWLAAPFPNSLNALIDRARVSPLSALTIGAASAAGNVRLFFTPTHGEVPEVLLRGEVIAALAACAIFYRRAPRTATEVSLVLGPVVAAVIGAGWVESWRDFRSVAPMLLVATLVAGARHPRVLRAAGVVNLCLLPAVLPTFVRLHEPRFKISPIEIRRFGEAVRPYLQFRPDATGWENTVLAQVDTIQYPLLGLPRGFGISFVIEWEDQQMPPRSRYLLLRRVDVDQLPRTLRLTPLVETSAGTLYRNEAIAPATSAAGSW